MNNLMEYSLQIREVLSLQPTRMASIYGACVYPRRGQVLIETGPRAFHALTQGATECRANLGLRVDCGSVHQEMRELDMAMEMCCAMTSS